MEKTCKVLKKIGKNGMGSCANEVCLFVLRCYGPVNPTGPC